MTATGKQTEALAADIDKKTKPGKTKADETLKVAYTLTGEAFGDVVVFGTDTARTEFLRTHPDVWWRIADVTKGQTLTEATA